MKLLRTTGLAAFFLAVVQTLAVAAPAALPMQHEIDLEAYKGQTFLETMIEPDTGIKAHLDADYTQEYTFADWAAVQPAVENFDTKVQGKLLRAFETGSTEDSMTALEELTNKLEGKTFTPATMIRVMNQNTRIQGRGIFDVAQFFALASGAGTLVRLNDDNYYYNYGYKSGAERDDVKSGRSFGAGPEHAANDASDKFFLTELEEYLDTAPKPRQFYKTIMQILTQSDASGLSSSKLSGLGQTTITDFVAIYTAESDRHIMVNLKPAIHPWENDLAEVVFLSAYGSVEGKVMKGGVLTDAPIWHWWAPSEISNRSGIGITRKDRRALQRMVSDYERGNHPELVEAVENLIDIDTVVASQGRGKRYDGDVFRLVMENLNNFKTQKNVRANAEALTEAFVDFLMQVREDAPLLTEHVLAQ